MPRLEAGAWQAAVLGCVDRAEAIPGSLERFVLRMVFQRVPGLRVLAVAAVLSGTCLRDAGATDPPLAQIAELRAELAQMKARNGEHWLTGERVDQIRGLVEDVLADAETRRSLRSTAADAGYDRGFFISSDDGAFTLKVNGLMQARFIFNGSTKAGSVLDPATGSAVPFHDGWGFDVRRARANFSGTIDRDWRYLLQVQYSSSFAEPVREPNASSFGEGDVQVLKAYVERSFEIGGNRFTALAGQFKAPFMREWLLEPGDLMAIDFSLLTYYFYPGYSTGLQLSWESDSLRATMAFTNGVGTPEQAVGRGSFNTSWVGDPTRYSFAGRLDLKLGGDWTDFDNFNSPPGTEPGLLIGAGGFYQLYNDRFLPPNANGFAVGGVTADVTWKFGGASLIAAFVWESDQNGPRARSPWGVMVQGGWFLNDQIEIFTQYDRVATADSDGSPLSVLTVGLNWFPIATAKLSVDLAWALDTDGTFFSGASTVGFRPAFDVGSQYAIRTQLQVTF